MEFSMIQTPHSADLGFSKISTIDWVDAVLLQLERDFLRSSASYLSGWTGYPHLAVHVRSPVDPASIVVWASKRVIFFSTPW